MKKILIAIYLMVFMTAAEGGILLKYEQESNIETKKTYFKNVYVDKDFIRIDNVGLGTGIIFDKGNKVLISYDAKNRMYKENTREEFAKIQQDKMEQIKNVSERMSTRIPGRMPGNTTRNTPGNTPKNTPIKIPEKENKEIAGPFAKYLKKSENEKINEWTCAGYEVIVDKRKAVEVWTVSMSQLGFSDEEMDTVRAFNNFVSITVNVWDFVFFGTEEYEKKGGYSGFPVKIIKYKRMITRELEPETISVITDVKQQNFESSIFQIHKGYGKIIKEE